MIAFNFDLAILKITEITAKMGIMSILYKIVDGPQYSTMDSTQEYFCMDNMSLPGAISNTMHHLSSFTSLLERMSGF